MIRLREEKVSGQIPLLKGEGAAKQRVRGAEILLFTPHPALRATLSLQERDLSAPIITPLLTFRASRAFTRQKWEV